MFLKIKVYKILSQIDWNFTIILFMITLFQYKICSTLLLTLFCKPCFHFSFWKKSWKSGSVEKGKMHFDSYCKYASKLYQQVYCEEEDEDQTSDEICDEHCHQKEVRINFAESLFYHTPLDFYRKLWQIFSHCQTINARRLFDDCLTNACQVPDSLIT